MSACLQLHMHVNVLQVSIYCDSKWKFASSFCCHLVFSHQQSQLCMFYILISSETASLIWLSVCCFLFLFLHLRIMFFFYHYLLVLTSLLNISTCAHCVYCIVFLEYFLSNSLLCAIVVLFLFYFFHFVSGHCLVPAPALCFVSKIFIKALLSPACCFVSCAASNELQTGWSQKFS